MHLYIMNLLVVVRRLVETAGQGKYHAEFHGPCQGFLDFDYLIHHAAEGVVCPTPYNIECDQHFDRNVGRELVGQ